MPKAGSYRAEPTLGHVALHWARRNGVTIGTTDPEAAQRALEIALDAMPYSLRAGTYGWPMARRGWCRAHGQPDPRAHLRHAKRRDIWTHWLATVGHARGDVISETEADALACALPSNAELYLPLLSPHRRAWRWATRPHVIAAPGYALLLQRTTDGQVLIDCVPTLKIAPAAAAASKLSAERTSRSAVARRQARAALLSGQFSGQSAHIPPSTTQ